MRIIPIIKGTIVGIERVSTARKFRIRVESSEGVGQNVFLDNVHGIAYGDSATVTLAIEPAPPNK